MNKWMRLLVVFLMVGLTACAGQQVKTSPVSTRFSDTIKSQPPLEEVNATPLPPLPRVVATKDINGNAIAGFDADGMNRLLHFRAVAENNTKLADELVATTNSVIRERNAVVRLGQLEEERANHYAEMYVETNEALKQERRDYVLAKWSDRIFFILGLFLLK